VAIPKPDPTGIYKAMEKLNIKDKSEILYIGDNDIDYVTATNAGVDALLVTWGPREIKSINQAKYNAKSYNEIGGILL
jgi:phosphoglycolate phosphatase